MRIKNINRTVFLILIALAAMNYGCHNPLPSQPGAPPHSAITLTASQITASSVQLTFTNDSNALSQKYLLIRNYKDTVFSGAVPRDSATQTVYDRTLTPERTYQYSVYRLVGATKYDSASLSVQSGDTTKDAYNFTFYRFGTSSSSIFTGIWLDNPNSIWLCGTAWNNGSGNGPNGIIHVLNGTNIGYSSDGDSGVGMPQSVYGLNDSNVWFCQPGLLLQWNGSNFVYYEFTNASLNYIQNWPYQYYCLWVASDGEVFSGADNGRILHLKADLKTWELMQAPTYYGISTIIGFSPSDIYASADNSNFDGILLHYNGTAWDSVHYDSTIHPGPFGVWGESADSLYLAGSGVYQENGTSWKNITPSSEIYVLGGIYSEGADNLFITGQDNYIAKWDGLKWIQFTSAFPPNLNAGFNHIIMLNGVFYGVGNDNSGAYYVIGQ